MCSYGNGKHKAYTLSKLGGKDWSKSRGVLRDRGHGKSAERCHQLILEVQEKVSLDKMYEPRYGEGGEDGQVD